MFQGQKFLLEDDFRLMAILKILKNLLLKTWCRISTEFSVEFFISSLCLSQSWTTIDYDGLYIDILIDSFMSVKSGPYFIFYFIFNHGFNLFISADTSMISSIRSSGHLFRISSYLCMNVLQFLTTVQSFLILSPLGTRSLCQYSLRVVPCRCRHVSFSLSLWNLTFSLSMETGLP